MKPELEEVTIKQKQPETVEPTPDDGTIAKLKEQVERESLLAEKRQELAEYESTTLKMKHELERIEVEAKLKQARGEFCQLSEVAEKKAELDQRQAELDAKMQPEDMEAWQQQLEKRERKVERREKEAANLPKRDKDLTRRENLLKEDKDKLSKDKAVLEQREIELKKKTTKGQQELDHLKERVNERLDLLRRVALQLLSARNDKERENILAGLITMFGLTPELEQDKKVQKIMARTRG